MPRRARSYYLSNFYHIIVQGDEKKFIFQKNKYKDKYIYLLKRNAFRNDVYIIAYCVMDNHVHILIHSNERERISKMMLQCGTAYGSFFSKERSKIGHVFRDRYKSEPIWDQNHLINCIKYIHENPVKAGVVENCSEYLYSSYNEFIGKTEVYENFKYFSTVEEEYIDVISNMHTDEQYIEPDGDFEDLDDVFEKIKLKYDLRKLNNKEIIEIYWELKERCNATKSLVAKLLNIERCKFGKLVKK